MAHPTPHRVDPADERRHAPGPERLWNESYYLDFVADEGAIAGYARVGFCPNLGVTWWTTMIVGTDRPVAASVAYDLPAVPGDRLALSGGGCDLRIDVTEPLATMGLQATAPACLYDEASAIYRGDPGRPSDIGIDLSWTTDGVPYHYDFTTRYEVPCLVSGQITVGSDRITVNGQGQRDHSWGVRDWWAFAWCWMSARLDDGTRVHVTDIRIPGQRVAVGYVQPPDGPVHSVSGASVTEVPGVEGMPSSGRVRIELGGLDLQIEPLAFGPLLLVAEDGQTSRFSRAAARFTAEDGRSGTGWIEWNQPDHAHNGR
jgi:hypothetical protein